MENSSLFREHIPACNFLKSYPHQGPCCCEALTYAAAVKDAAFALTAPEPLPAVAPTVKRTDARRMPYTGPFPRKRHYHRCPQCKNHGGNGVNCYKQKCALPVLLSDPCSWCR
jgi:hypothetical protein